MPLEKEMLAELQKLVQVMTPKTPPPPPPPPKGMWNEFKAFLGKGGVLSLAVGFIMGTYIGTVVTALVRDIIMPIPGAFTPKGQWQTANATIAVGNGMTFFYGDFIAVVINFLIVAFAVFIIVRYATRMGIK